MANFLTELKANAQTKLRPSPYTVVTFRDGTRYIEKKNGTLTELPSECVDKQGQWGILAAACSVCGHLGHTSVQCKQLPPVMSENLPVDFDEAGRRLLERVAASIPTNEIGEICQRTKACKCRLCSRDWGILADIHTGRYNALNVIWAPPEGEGGQVYVGGLKAAKDLRLLHMNGITHVVNCMDRPSINTLDAITYFNFPIERCREILFEQSREYTATLSDVSVAAGASAPRAISFSPLSAGLPQTAGNAAAVHAFFSPVMRFIREASMAGGNVLIHCFAGAHRAGTTGVAFLMYAEHLRATDALATAQRLRPVIDPQAYPQLWSLLTLLEMALFSDSGRSALDDETDISNQIKCFVY